LNEVLRASGAISTGSQTDKQQQTREEGNNAQQPKQSAIKHLSVGISSTGGVSIPQRMRNSQMVLTPFLK
jgi:hypothetical protein